MSILALTSDTLIGTPATGNLEYNGQFFGTDSVGSRAQLQRIVRGTAITASTATIDITGIPSWAKRIEILFSGVSLNGTSQFLFQLGTSGGFVSTGYTGAGARYNGSTFAAANFTTGATYANITTGIVFSGSTVFTNTSSNLWVWSGQLGSGSATEMFGTTNGGISLGGTLTQLRITTVGGVNTYSGTINIIYEG
jgi:hypothetical protein